MKNFHDLMRRVLEDGIDVRNERAGKVCRTLVGETLRFNLDDGFPAITTKKLAFRSVVGELLGFFRGYTDAAQFRALGCTIWDKNANETAGWLANPYRRGLDDLGRIYGAQWTQWRDRRIVATVAEMDRLASLGYRESMREERVGGGYECLMERTINQLEDVLRRLRSDPSDRRLIVSGWNVAELDMMALPPCHMDYRFVTLPDHKAGHRLSVVMTIRSWDLFLGGPFNIASTALFLAIMARLAGMKAHEVIIQATNAHIYYDHFDAVESQLRNDPLPLATLTLSPEIARIDTVESIEGAFSRIEPAQIALSGYVSHAAIAAPMAA